MINDLNRISAFLAAVLLSLGFAAVAMADEDQAAEDEEEVEEIEDVEVVEVVQALDSVSRPDAVESPSISVIYGRLHPAFVHVPIGILVLLIILDAMALFRGEKSADKAGLTALIAAVISALPALLSGLARTSEMWSQNEPPPLLHSHRLIMFAMTGALVSALVLRLFKRNKLEGPVKFIYALLLLAALALAAWGGHMGGKLVFGEHHLPF